MLLHGIGMLSVMVFPWISMDFMDIHGILWISMDLGLLEYMTLLSVKLADSTSNSSTQRQTLPLNVKLFHSASKAKDFAKYLGRT